MAEINVEPRKSSGNNSWIWIILVLAIVAAAAYFLTRNNDADENLDVDTTVMVSKVPNSSSV